MAKYYAARYESGRWLKVPWEKECKSVGDALLSCDEWCVAAKLPSSPLFVDTRPDVSEKMNGAQKLANEDFLAAQLIYSKRVLPGVKSWSDMRSRTAFRVESLSRQIAEELVVVSEVVGSLCKVTPTQKYIDEVLQPGEVDFSAEQLHAAMFGGTVVPRPEKERRYDGKTGRLLV